MITFKIPITEANETSANPKGMAKKAHELQQRLRTANIINARVSWIGQGQFSIVGPQDELFMAIKTLNGENAEPAIIEVRQINPSLSKY